MKRRTYSALLLTVAMIATSCSSSSYAISADKRAGVASMGVNNTGRTDITEAQWVAIAARACNEGGWDWEVARRIADEMIGPARGPAQPGSGANTVWLMLTVGCHELVPDDALLRGPPGL